MAAGTGDVVHDPCGAGTLTSDGSGQLHHRDLLPGPHRRCHRADHSRAGSGFYNRDVIDACRKADVRFSVTAKLHAGLRKVVEAIPE